MESPLAPCGICRRCAIHDDPGGCLTVEAWVREHPEEAAAVEAAYEAYDDAYEYACGNRTEGGPFGDEQDAAFAEAERLHKIYQALYERAGRSAA